MPEAFLARQRQLGSLGGKCAGSVGENKFLVEVAVDGRARCQLRTCKEPLKIGELRLGKRPPSLRHGHNPKVTWYHPECAMKAFLACSAKSRVVEKVEDIDHGWDALSDTNKAFIRSIIDGAPKSQAPRKIQRKPSPPTEKINETDESLWVPKRGDDCYSLWRGHAARPLDVPKALETQGLRLRPRRPLGAEARAPALATHPAVEPAARFTRYGPHGPVP